jgi:hypothetical protein
MIPAFSRALFAQAKAPAQESGPSADELYDIVELAPETSIWPLVFYSFLVLLLLTGIALIIRYYLRSRKTSTAKESPVLIAQRQLRQLEQSEGELEPNRYALALSETVKDFLAATFADPVRYETTQEFLGRLSRQGTSLPPAAQQELRDFLIAAEEVKFGNAPGSEARTAPLLQKAKNLLSLCTAINSESTRKQPRQG